MAERAERLIRINEVLKLSKNRLSGELSEERSNDIRRLIEELESRKTELTLEALRGKKILLVDSHRIIENLPDYIGRTGAEIIAESSIPRDFASRLENEEFDGALVHMVSTSNEDLVRVISNRILKAGYETTSKIVVMYGNYAGRNLNIGTILDLFDSVGVRYVEKSADGLKGGMIELASMFENS